MYRGVSVAVVIPAFNEERAIGGAIEAVPAWVDHVIVVDDASTDATASIAAAHPRAVDLVRHRHNRGVGAAIITGYRRVLEHPRAPAIAVVMAGDGQMDPADLPALLDPVIDRRADYAKGNRFRHPDVWRAMPPVRILGNLALSVATRLTSGYRRVFDSQCGYTAITRRALGRIELDRVFPRYGYPNDFLARLHVIGARVVDVPVRPVYGPGWKSGIRVPTVVYPVTYVLLRSWGSRLVAETGRRALPAEAPADPAS
jgi:glycosyltransferase involved in cell wall biosynthesis